MIMGKTALRGAALVILALLLGACSNLVGLSEKIWSYTVSFNKNGGDTEAVPAAKTVTNPATTLDTLPAPPARSGYNFAGWNTRADGAGTAFDSTTTVSGDITVYAQWTEIPPGPYTVVFKLNDGTETNHATKTVAPPASAIAAKDFPSNPVRSGYVFAGWSAQAGGGGEVFTASSTVADNLTVYAQWTEILPGSYMIVFKLNDGTETNHAIKTLAPPATVIAAGNFPANPTRSGYNFAGWNTRADGSGTAFDSTTTVSSDSTVYARWTEIPSGSYTVVFKLNDGTETNHATKTLAPPASAIAAEDFPSNPVRPGYNFAGWNTRADGGGAAFDSTTTVGADSTVYAQWESYSYTVVFNKNGGDTEANPASKTVASPATGVDALPAPPTRTGYEFGGWDTQADGGGAAFDSTTTVAGNLTVYAQWNSPASLTVTLQPAPGDPSLSNVELDKDVSQSFSAAAGHTSWQWYWDGELIEGANTATYILGANLKPPGIYELSVVTTSPGGAKLSSRCRVTIKDK
jgi:uncharacterized repeat protein (TIGR02543 family)